MTRTDRLVILAVLGTGVFLGGLELMITAVALPAILADLASWTELRRASWVVTVYLLVSVVAMPLAGRLADGIGARRLFLGALAVFIVGSVVSGAARSLDALIAGRAIQAAGGGALVPVATAAAAHLFDDRDRPRALGVIGALTFLGMAVGPFAGAAILELLRPADALAAAGVGSGPLVELLAPAWRWVFYVNAPVGVAALALGWAASAGWETPRRPSRPDVAGALLVTGGLAALLVGISAIDDQLGARLLDPGYPPVRLAGVGSLLLALAVAAALRSRAPFLDVRIFARPVLSAAALVALLTGYALATAIVGGAVFVDRVLYAGPATQRVALGALGAATAVGALVAGLLVRRSSPRAVTIAGLLLSAAALGAMATWSEGTAVPAIAAGLGLFGLGFGLTLTSRSTAAVEAAGRAAFGVASAVVTVARMLGMALGLAVLTAYGATTIERLNAAVFATPEAYRRYLPAELRDRTLADPRVVGALEDWAAREAAGIVVGLFAVAAVVTLAALLPALALGRPPSPDRDGRPGADEGTMLDRDG